MARRVLDGEGRRLEGEYLLDEWFRSSPELRARYFDEITHISRVLRNGGREPPDNVIVQMLAIMCEEDRSLDDHIGRQNFSNPPWMTLRVVAGAVALEAYIVEREKSA